MQKENYTYDSSSEEDKDFTLPKNLAIKSRATLCFFRETKANV